MPIGQQREAPPIGKAEAAKTADPFHRRTCRVRSAKNCARASLLFNPMHEPGQTSTSDLATNYQPTDKD